MNKTEQSFWSILYWACLLFGAAGVSKAENPTANSSPPAAGPTPQPTTEPAGNAEELEAQILAEPNNIALRKSLGILYLDTLRQPTKALPHLEAVVEAQPDDADWLEILARAQQDAGKKEIAVETFRKSAGIDLRNPWVRRELATTLSSLSRYREAEVALREAVELDPSADVRLELARVLHVAGQREAAAEIARDVLSSEPENVPATELLAKINGVKPRFSRAASLKQVKELEERLKTDPDDVELSGALGIVYLENLDQPIKALPYLEKASASQVGDVAWLQALAKAQRGANHTERAVETLRKCISIDPDDIWLRSELAAALSSLGRNREAEQTLREAIKIDESNSYLWVALARALLAQGQREAAAKAAKSALQADPKNGQAKELLARTRIRVPSPHEQAVTAAYRSKDPAQFLRAAGALKDHLRRNPGDIANRKTLGFIYLEKLHDPRAAIGHLEKVVQVSPNDANWLQILARAYESDGQYKQAADAYSQAAACSPRDVWARYHLARTLRELKRPKQAQEALDEALAIEPNNNHVKLETARLAHTSGHETRAARLVDEILADDPSNSGARVLRGDIYRADWNFRRAEAEYKAVADGDGWFPSAQSGMAAIKNLQKRDYALTFYTFNDTDDFRQSGIFGNLTLFSTGPFRFSAVVNELFFGQPPAPDITRFEAGLGLDYRFNRWLQISGGAGLFKTENVYPKFGGNVAVNVSPARALDLWFSYRYSAPVNYSYITVADAFTQDIISGGFSLRPTRNTVASFTATNADFSDGNTRHFVLATLAHYLPLWASPVLKLEYEWLDYAFQTSQYSSPQNYSLLRPVLELSPQITKWLSIDFRGELPYVFDEQQWGTGLVVGPRITLGDWLNISVQYFNYQIPGGQSTWSGSGFKAQVSGRF